MANNMDPFGELEDFASSFSTLTPQSVTATISRRTSAWIFGEDESGPSSNPRNGVVLPQKQETLEQDSCLSSTAGLENNVNMDNALNFDNFDLHSELDKSTKKVSHFSSSARMSTRQRTLTEKGLAYQIDLQSKVLKSSMKTFKQLMETYDGELYQHNLTLYQNCMMPDKKLKVLG